MAQLQASIAVGMKQLLQNIIIKRTFLADKIHQWDKTAGKDIVAFVIQNPRLIRQ